MAIDSIACIRPTLTDILRRTLPQDILIVQFHLLCAVITQSIPVICDMHARSRRLANSLLHAERVVHFVGQEVGSGARVVDIGEMDVGVDGIER